MSYYKYSEIYLAKFEIAFYELDIDMICIRAVYIVDNEIFNTSLHVDKPNFTLPEGRFEHTDALVQIDELEFQEIWKESTLPYAPDWSLLKTNLNEGGTVEGSIVCFYPQGVILTSGLRFFCIADYDLCKNRLGEDKMYPGNKLSLIVQGFDDVNMWIKVE